MSAEREILMSVDIRLSMPRRAQKNEQCAN